MTIIDDMPAGSHHVNLLIINIENGVNREEGKVTTRNHITRGRSLGMTSSDGQFDLRRGQTMRDTEEVHGASRCIDDV